MLKKLFEHKILLIKLTVLVVISILYLGRSFNDFEKPFIKGDGLEYVMMCEGFYNHYSPDIDVKDMESFKARFCKYNKWEELWGGDTFDNYTEFFRNTQNTFKENSYMGFFCNRNQKWYCMHFFFYSLINMPSYVLAKKFNPIRSFYITNALLVILTCIVLLFFTPFSTFNQILAALSYCFSCCYWYLGWQHAEVFACSLVAISLVFLFNKRNYWALFFLAIACLQNQPLIILLGLYGLISLHQDGINKKNILYTGLLMIIAFIPPVFYYVNFGTTNLINDVGYYLDKKYITSTRIFGFYTDINQGMILTIPIILLLYIPLVINEALKMIRKRTAFEFTILIPLALLIINFIISTQGNWNHGMAIINRYATWMSIIIMIHVFYLVSRQTQLVSIVLFNYFFVTQCFTTLYHQQFNEFDWSSAHFTPLSKWALNNHPELYNPDPKIFIGRCQPGVDLIEENSPVIYFHHRQVKKIMIHRNKIDDLANLGYSKEVIAKIKKKIKFQYDWGYVSNRFKPGKSGGEIYSVMRQRKLNDVYSKIQTSKTWMDQIREKAKLWGKTYEEACWIDAEYIVARDERKEEME